MATLPSGTVTLLFTDIEGSTQLLHGLGERYAETLADHRRALRAAFLAHGGVEVDTQGDAFFVAFASAKDAVAAAHVMERRVSDHPGTFAEADAAAMQTGSVRRARLRACRQRRSRGRG